MASRDFCETISSSILPVTIEEMICEMEEDETGISQLEKVIDFACVKIQSIKIKLNIKCTCIDWPCTCTQEKNDLLGIK